MATQAQFVTTPQSAQVQISVANTARDGTGTLGTLYTAPATGTRVDDLYIKATGTTTAGMVRMFVSDGTNHRLVDEFAVSPITPSSTVASWSYRATNLGIVLESGWSLRFSTHNGEVFNVVMTRGGDF